MMTAMKRLLVVTACALVLAACGEPGSIDAGGGDGGGSDGSTGGPDEPVSSTLDPNEPMPAPSPSLVEPQPGQENVRPIRWESYEADGRTVTIAYWSGVEPCAVLDHVEVEEGDKRVTVTLFEGNSPSDEDVACIEIAVFKGTVVELSEPLGDRKVVDGAPK
jgi:hypothetical protein